ncbi:MAG: 50S ribosomal protein L7ae [Gemmatimonadetes bacterium]|nr:50S ribosomal protein L7ae [Gemmatimonadota bacterium]NIO30716.1 50S ribosomal protein L7ae [Gemmatimonadota bacterium]
MSPTSESEAAGRLLGSLGLAARAGRLRVGIDAVAQSVSRGDAAAVVVAGDAPENVRRKLERLVTGDAPPKVVVLDGERLGRAVGRERVVVMAVTDRSLGDRVVELAEAVGV